MTHERLKILCMGAVVAVSALGCQRIVDVSGTVRVDGKPARGLVAFHSLAPPLNGVRSAWGI
jgi:hypothetical protein